MSFFASRHSDGRIRVQASPLSLPQRLATGNQEAYQKDAYLYEFYLPGKHELPRTGEKYHFYLELN